MCSFHYSISFMSLLLLITISQIGCASAPSATNANTCTPTKLVDKVCKLTSAYSFCVKSLYSDSRTPEADQYTLAFVSVGLAYVNATSTRDRISELLQSGSTRHRPLQRCLRNYDKAILILGMADNDLNSETFYELADLANQASRATDDCEAAFKGFPSPPLANSNKDLKGLCEICGILGKLFTGIL